MALILVVEPEDRYVQRVHDALSSEGWQVEVVASADAALARAEQAPPQLVVASQSLDGAERLFSGFSRRTGGPGVIALLPESATEDHPSADETLFKPFTDQDLRLAVRRGLQPKPQAPAAPSAPTGGAQLTAEDIFGDVVAEVEGSGHASAPTAPRPPRTASSSPGARSGELDLEKTLSGLRRDLKLGDAPKTARPEAPPRPEADARTTAPKKPPPVVAPKTDPPRRPPTRRPDEDDDLGVDALLSATLSGLDLPRKRKKATPLQEREDTALESTAQPSEAGESTQAAASDAPGAEELSFADLLGDEEKEAHPRTPGSAAPGSDARAAGDRKGEAGAPGGDGGGDDGDDLIFPVTDDEPPPSPHIHGGDLSEVLGRDEASGDGPPSARNAGGADAVASSPDLEILSGGDEDEARDDEPELDPADPRRFGQYTLLDRIAVGGMAEVWKARMSGVEGFQKTVAIKKILPHLTDNDDFVHMFIDEAKLAAQLNHPGIIHIYDLGKLGEQLYIAMEYVEGKNLRAVLNEARTKALRMPQDLAMLVAARLGAALNHAHRKKDFEGHDLGLVHRDVSPQNVLLSTEGDIKLCDFGIVKAVSKASHTQMGALKGKIQYMSPEQAWGKEVDARSDIFSLGALLFEMLTGQRLFSGDNEISVLEAVRQCQVRAPRDLDPEIPPELEAIVLHALEMEPEDRFQTAGEMQQRLEAILYAEPPTPKQGDLADWLRELDAAEEVDEDDQLSASAAPPGGVVESRARSKPGHDDEGDDASLDLRQILAGSGAGEVEADAYRTERLSRADLPLSLDDPPEPETGSEGSSPPVPPDEAATSAESAATTSAEVLAPPEDGEVEIEEGGSSGRRGLWIALIVVLLLGIGATVYVLWFRPGPDDSAPDPAAVQESVPTPADEAPDVAEPDAGDTAAGDDAAQEDSEGIPVGGSEAAEPADRIASTEGDDPTGRATTTNSATTTDRTAQADTRGSDAARPSASGSSTLATQPRSEPAPTRPTAESPTPASNTRRETTPPVNDPSSRTADGAPVSEDSPSATSEATEATTTPERVLPEVNVPPEEDPLARIAAERRAREREAELKADEASSEAPQEAEPRRGSPDAQRDDRRAEARSEPEPETPVSPQPPPEAPVREGDLVGSGPGVVPPKLVTFPKPSYPPLARRMRAEGDVVLSLLVDENGRVLETRLVQGAREGVGLNEAALDAARRARYQPATKDGVKVKMWTTLKIPFRL